MSTIRGADSIFINLYKIDLAIVKAQSIAFENLEDIPALLVKEYNERVTGGKKYTPVEKANLATFSRENSLTFYAKLPSNPIAHSWVNFFAKAEVPLEAGQGFIPNFVCFVVHEQNVYAFTAGSAVAIFEAYIDISFPTEFAKRTLKPEITAAKQQQISGQIMVSDIYFRRPTPIGVNDRLHEVWRNLKGDLKDEIRNSPGFKEIFGDKGKVGMEIKGSIQVKAKVSDPRLLVSMLRWVEDILERPLTVEQEQSFAFLDDVRCLDSRKDQVLIKNLDTSLATKFFDADALNEDFLSIVHERVSEFINAESYHLSFRKKQRPLKPSQLDAVSITQVVYEHFNPEDLGSPLEQLRKLKLHSAYEEQAFLNTDGSIWEHLNGEISYQGKTYYLLNGRWFQLQSSFLQNIEKKMEDILEEGAHTSLKHSDLSLAHYTQSTEPEYNAAQAGEGRIIADKVFLNNLELADVIHYGDPEFVDIIHIKRGLNATVRELASQIRNSMNMIEHDLPTGCGKLKQYYNELKQRGLVSDMEEDEFLEIVKRKRRYVFGYIHNSAMSPSMTNLRSSIAKLELVSLASHIRQFNRSSLHFVHIPRILE